MATPFCALLSQPLRAAALVVVAAAAVAAAAAATAAADGGGKPGQVGDGSGEGDAEEAHLARHGHRHEEPR